MIKLIAINEANEEVKINWNKIGETFKLEIDNQPANLTIYNQKTICNGSKLVANYKGRIVGTSDLYNLGHFKNYLLKEIFKIKYKVINM